MANKNRGYVGQIGHSGNLVVNAPCTKNDGQGKSTVKTGNDLRNGSRK